jgi:dipeptidyl aminopeptidase/acylaminoacyl peptidase
MYDVGLNWAFQNFAATGYAVLYTNPRGGTGFGSGIQDFAPGDYDHLMAWVDTAIAKGVHRRAQPLRLRGSGGVSGPLAASLHR